MASARMMLVVHAVDRWRRLEEGAPPSGSGKLLLTRIFSTVSGETVMGSRRSILLVDRLAMATNSFEKVQLQRETTVKSRKGRSGPCSPDFARLVVNSDRNGCTKRASCPITSYAPLAKEPLHALEQQGLQALSLSASVNVDSLHLKRTATYVRSLPYAGCIHQARCSLHAE